ncbi:MAG: hypothetical protein IPK32_20710 [Verrucomicrobiaceae bacterium]|nr:hypothetical protein [Verrucomicrobiaceae bacterium]
MPAKFQLMTCLVILAGFAAPQAHAQLSFFKKKKEADDDKQILVAAVTPKTSSTGISSGSSTAKKSATLPRIEIPSATAPGTGYARYPWKLDIVSTVFWVGESPTENNPVPNDKSSWDTEWQKNFGGFDDPDRANRTDHFTPAAFTPKQNPFYIALPYNDVIDYNTHKSKAKVMIPWFKEKFKREGKSVLKGTWVAIRHGNRVCYAQWEDCGPFETDDVEYVFGNSRPRNTSNNGAGIDISPAVRDYLGLNSMSKCDWRFVDVSEVPAGPWRNWGSNNPFAHRLPQQSDPVRTKTEISNRLDELRRMRDEYFKSRGQ